MKSIYENLCEEIARIELISIKSMADQLTPLFNRLPEEKKARIMLILDNYKEICSTTPHGPSEEGKLREEDSSLRSALESARKLFGLPTTSFNRKWMKTFTFLSSLTLSTTRTQR